MKLIFALLLICSSLRSFASDNLLGDAQIYFKDASGKLTTLSLKDIASTPKSDLLLQLPLSESSQDLYFNFKLAKDKDTIKLTTIAMEEMFRKPKRNAFTFTLSSADTREEIAKKQVLFEQQLEAMIKKELKDLKLAKSSSLMKEVLAMVSATLMPSAHADIMGNPRVYKTEGSPRNALRALAIVGTLIVIGNFALDKTSLAPKWKAAVIGSSLLVAAFLPEIWDLIMSSADKTAEENKKKKAAAKAKIDHLDLNKEYFNEMPEMLPGNW